MKKYLKYIVVFILVISSFYITEKSALFLRNKDPLLQSIKDYSKEYNTEAVNAKINDTYIIPGLSGKKVNEIKSLMKMKSLKAFNSLFLATETIKPDISLEDNKDKIINKGNENKKAIAFILENDESNIITYLISEKINASILVYKDSVGLNNKLEQINNDFNSYDDVEKILNKNKSNTNICIINRNNKNFCIRRKKYLVEPTHILTSNNLVLIKNNLKSGDIILVKDSVSIDDFSYLINYIKSKDLNIIKLSEIISENNS